MSEDVADKKSCGTPQPLLTNEPTSEWLPDQLSIYAQIQYQQIVDGETRLTQPYWRLGHALGLAKKTFDHGQWAQYLEHLGIDKTRASKARAIYRTFSKEEDVAGLTVEEAYAQRQRKRSATPPAPAAAAVESKKSIQSLRTSVGKIAQRTGAVVHDAAFAAPEEAVILIPAVRKAIRELEVLLEFLEQQAAAVSMEDKPEAAGSLTTATGARGCPAK
jgi:hypothetical protein